MKKLILKLGVVCSVLISASSFAATNNIGPLKIVNNTPYDDISANVTGFSPVKLPADPAYPNQSPYSTDLNTQLDSLRVVLCDNSYQPNAYCFFDHDICTQGGIAFATVNILIDNNQYVTNVTCNAANGAMVGVTQHYVSALPPHLKKQ
ncbi:MAG: hypothetical protein KIT27_07615 [Legionellales bacterium]|nr:hypothetical protein [Legionellales bacterium]